MAPFDLLRSWLAKARASKLSTRVTVLFVLPLVVPWFAYAWLIGIERAESVGRAERNLAAVAAAYGEHAATLMRLGISVPTGNDVSQAGLRGTEHGGEEIAAFRRALNLPGVVFSLRKIGKPAARLRGANGPDADYGLEPKSGDGNGVITAEVDRPAAGIAAAASVNESEALGAWRARARTEGITLIVRTLFGIGVGIFLVYHLRRREAVEAELVTAKEGAEAASRAKSAFLANMSHDLRTPLNAIIGFSEIIKMQKFGSSSERYPEYAADIFDSGTHLLTLINDILNLSRLEAGRFTLEEENVNLTDMVEACVAFVRPQARQAKVLLSLSLDSQACIIRADEQRLRQALNNLLSNAIKFTPPGGQVRVACVQKNGGPVLSVSDTGIGMTPDDIHKALTPFDQPDSRVRRKQEGPGLGLPLAKHLIELHGGTLAIESAIGSGTTVTVILPPERIVPSQERAMAAFAAG